MRTHISRGKEPQSHQFPLVAQAEGADGPRRGRAERCGAVQDALVAQARLSVPAVLPEQQHVGQVGDVAGGQPQRLYLGELPVGGLGGDERAQRREGRVDAVRPVPLPRVRRLPLLAHAAQSPLSPSSSSSPPATAAPSPLLDGRRGLRLLHLLPRNPPGVPAGAVGAVAAALLVLRVGGEALRARGAAAGLHPVAGRGGMEPPWAEGVKIAPREVEQLPPIR